MKLGEMVAGLFGDKKEVLGSGSANKAAGVIEQRKAYTDYAVAQAEQGLPAVKFDEFIKGKR